MAKRVIVIGGSFAGLTAAIELKNLLPDCEVTVIDRKEKFLFMPSLIWLAFGLRQEKDITFALRPVLESKKVIFKHAEVINIDLNNRVIACTDGSSEPYDFLVIATGPQLNYEAVPGLGPEKGYSQSVFSFEHATRASVAFNKFLDKPGPVVIGAVQGASCFGAAYEYMFNMSHQLKKHGLLKKVPLTFVTAEPYLAHMGLGGFGTARQMTEFMFKQIGAKAELNAEFKEVRQNEIELTDGRVLPFNYAMLTPSYLGVDVVRKLTDIVDANGFVKITDQYNTQKYPEVFACGVAISLPAPQETPVPCAVPKTGYLSEEMAKVAAHNIKALITGTEMMAKSPAVIDAKCIMDAGDSGIIMSADHFLEPREQVWLIPGPEAHWAKLAFEKYFLITHKHGIV